MSSALQDIAETLATDFREAVIDAEKADVETIEKILKDLNTTYLDYFNKEALLDTQQEQALRTLTEIGNLRDVNTTTCQRRVDELRKQLAEFRETKIAAKGADVAIKGSDNIVQIGNKT